MSATILERTISSVVGNNVVLNNGRFARGLSFGTSWNKIRIGVQLNCNDSGGDLLSTPQIFIGVCSGTAGFFGDASATNACGIIQNNAQWTRGSNASAAWYGGLYMYPAKQVGNTVTISGTNLNGSGSFVFAKPQSYWGDVIFVDIQKGSPNYSFWFFGNVGLSEWSEYSFLRQMEVATPVYTNHTYYGPTTFAVDEVAGTFDSICVDWDRSDVSMEFANIAVARLS